jgi:bifunctional UDP-N-acetylglucosamine pyrophosphorylase/glucosamine-1-phosphate N-acetyltransferase
VSAVRPGPGAAPLSQVTAVILAAGEGKRMLSDQAKVLHPMAGRPLLDHVLVACEEAGVPRAVVVVGARREQVEAWLAARPHTAMRIATAVQAEQHGTGHALRCALPAIGALGKATELLVLCGDAPLLRARTVNELVARHESRHAGATILTADLPDPTGYGRIVRDASGEVERIVEHKDASPAERMLHEINSADYVFDRAGVTDALAHLKADNRQGELYLTDTIALLKGAGRPILALKVDDPREVLGVNTQDQLAEAERAFEARAREDR